MPYYGGTPMAADPKFLMQRLMASGMSRAQAAAVLGNLQRESGLASNNVNKDEGAYGLMQWRGPRFEQLQQFAAAKGVPWTDPGAQADFIAHEMATTERKNAAPFMAARTVDEASAALKPVIRYGDDSGPERAMHARNFFGADDAAPQTAAAPNGQATPASAQPAVSRETPEQRYYRQAYLADPAGRGSNARGMRGGLNSLGDLGAAFVAMKQRQAAAAQPQAPVQPGTDANPAFLGGRDSLAAQVAGPPPAAVDITSHQPVAQTPPGAPEPPRFPGGIPQPRPRPITGPGLPPDDRLMGGPTVAEMGSLVDPTGWDYG